MLVGLILYSGALPVTLEVLIRQALVGSFQLPNTITGYLQLPLNLAEAVLHTLHSRRSLVKVSLQLDEMLVITLYRHFKGLPE